MSPAMNAASKPSGDDCEVASRCKDCIRKVIDEDGQGIVPLAKMLKILEKFAGNLTETEVLSLLSSSGACFVKYEELLDFVMTGGAKQTGEDRPATHGDGKREREHSPPVITNTYADAIEIAGGKEATARNLQVSKRAHTRVDVGMSTSDTKKRASTVGVVEVAHCTTVAQLVEALGRQDNQELTHFEFTGHCSSADEAAELAEALQTYKNPTNDDIVLDLQDSCFGQHWGTLLRAIASNKEFVEWNFARTDLHDRFGLKIAVMLESCQWVKALNVQDTQLSTASLAAITRGILNVKMLEAVRIVGNTNIDLSEELLEACVQVKMAWPNAAMGEPPYGLFLESLIIMRMIESATVKAQIQQRQRLILKAVVNGDHDSAQKTWQLLREQVSLPEHKRVVQLLPLIAERYAGLGGFEQLANLPKPFDQHSGTDGLKQWCTEPMQSMPKEHRIRALLGMAPYRQTVFAEVVNGVKRELDVLGMNGANEMYLLQPLVDAFINRHGLDELSVKVPNYEITGDGVAGHVKGRYELSGHINGYPIFSHESGQSHIYCEDGEWTIGPAVGAHGCYYFMEKETTDDVIINKDTPNTSPDYTWKGDALDNANLVFTVGISQLKLRDSVLSFLTKRAIDEQFRSQLAFLDDLCHVSFGPPKDYSRAIQKDPDYLFDMNRCTFEIDSPALMVVLFFLIQNRVHALGGQVTRVANYFVTNFDFEKNGGIMAKEMDRPPCLQLNLQICGWVSEVMILMPNLLKAKHWLHHLYGINRASSLMEVLMPIFMPDEDIDDAGYEHTAGSALHVVRAAN